MKSADFAAACGVATQSQSIYENGKGFPNAEYLMKACTLGADPMFLLIGVPAPAGALNISQEEKAALVAFHALSPKARAALMAMVAAMREEV